MIAREDQLKNLLIMRALHGLLESSGLTHHKKVFAWRPGCRVAGQSFTMVNAASVPVLFAFSMP
jgi:hypothetical protein